MKFKELKGMTREELSKKTVELEMELIKARAQSTRGTVAKNPHSIMTMRKTLAKIMHISSAQSLSAKKPAVTPGSHSKGEKKASAKKTKGGQ